MNFFNKKVSLAILIFVSIIVFGFGFWSGKNTVVCKVCKPEDVDFSLFWETWRTLSSTYAFPDKINTQNMIYGAISGMVKSLNDPYTVFFKPEDSKKFMEDVSGSFEGVGMEVGIRKDQLQVVAPIDGSPAQKAGIRTGDKIIKIDGKSTGDLTIDEAVNMIRGKRDTEVTLTILRNDWDNPKDFKLKRAVITVPTIKWNLMTVNSTDDTAYIKIDQFSENADAAFVKASYEILNTPAKKIILDLRNNPGGYLEVSQSIAGWFLERGQIVVREDFGDKKEPKLYNAEGNAQFSSYPMVVLMDEGTASASEILAAALRDNRGIKLIGKNSFGKGTVQELMSLSKGSIKVTIAKWLTPKGQLIHEVGLKPDVEVNRTEDDISNNKDPQLDKAIEILREIK